MAHGPRTELVVGAPAVTMRDEHPASGVGGAACGDVGADSLEGGWIEEYGALTIALAAHIRFTRLAAAEDV